MQPTAIALGSTPGASNLLNLAYTYNTKNGSANNPDNNGNVLTQTIIVDDVGSNPGFDAVQTYTYDPLNRIKTAEEVIDESSPVAWTQEFTYDRYGNRNFNESTTTTLTKNCGTDPNFVMCDADRERENPEIDKDTNRIEELQPDGDQDEDYEFDDAGNTILDPEGRQFFYDGENKQIAVKDINDNVIGEYVYDGDGRRVMKEVPLGGGSTETTIFVYDAGGKLVAEYSTTVAPQSTAQVSYLTNDHLGSPRITTDKNGKVYSRRDFLPFGEDLDINVTTERTSAIGYGSDTVRQKFTGHERDGETGLDYAKARMMVSSFGRFSSPDPTMASASLQNPQTWDRYVYVLNNPLVYSDPLGLWEIRQAEIEYGERTKKKDGKEITERYVKSVKIIVYKEDGDDLASLAKQLNISEEDAQKYLDTADADGNLQFSQAKGTIAGVFRSIEKRILDHEQDKLENPGKKDDQGWDCSRTSSTLAGAPSAVSRSGYNGLDNSIGSGLSNGVQNVSNEKVVAGDIVRFRAPDSEEGVHFATFLMFNSSGEPIVFSKSGASGPNEFGTASEIQRKYDAYGPPTPHPRNRASGTPYYRY